MYIKKCPSCGKEKFRNKDSYDRHIKTYIRKCKADNCNKQFCCKPFMKKKYCSKECGYKMHGKDFRVKNPQGLEKKYICQICSKQYVSNILYKKHLDKVKYCIECRESFCSEKSFTKFCSIKCMSKNFVGRWEGKKSPVYKENAILRTPKTCKTCRKNYYAYGNQKYCSIKCRDISGKNNGMYGKKHNRSFRKRQRQTMVENGYWVPQKDLSDFKIYHNTVWRYTRDNNLTILSNFERRGKSGIKGSFQLDHKFSVLEGFKNNIPPYIIGHIINLEMIPWKKNTKKRSWCSISKKELFNEVFENVGR